MYISSSKQEEGRRFLNLKEKPRRRIMKGGLYRRADNPVLDAARSLQSCLTLCDPIDGSPPGSSVPGILQARTLEWVAISFSNE